MLQNDFCKTLETKLSVNESNQLEFLGSGTYGIAFKGCFDKNCDNPITVKIIYLSNTYSDDYNHPSNIEFNMKLIIFISNK